MSKKTIYFNITYIYLQRLHNIFLTQSLIKMRNLSNFKIGAKLRDWISKLSYSDADDLGNGSLL